MFMAVQGFSLVAASGGNPTGSSLVVVRGRLIVAGSHARGLSSWGTWA